MIAFKGFVHFFKQALDALAPVVLRSRVVTVAPFTIVDFSKVALLADRNAVGSSFSTASCSASTRVTESCFMAFEEGDTPPTEFATDLEKLRILLGRFCNSEGEFAPHATLGQM
jgi:hypothetical protein